MSPLPQSIRLATIIALVVSSSMSFKAFIDAMTTASAGQVEPPEMPEWLRSLSTLNSADASRIEAANVEAFRSMTVATLEMQSSRMLVLLALASVSLLMCFMALRMRGSETVRTPFARMLGITALCAAVLRAIDGAQSTVIMQRGLAASNKVMATVPDMHAASESALGLYVAYTVFMITALVVISGYFRSDRVRDMLVAIDGPEPEPDDE